MLKKQPLENLPRQNQLNAYGGNEAGTSRFGSALGTPRLVASGRGQYRWRIAMHSIAVRDACD